MPATKSALGAPVFSYYRRLERAREYVLGHYPEPITLSQVAQAAGMERTAFSSFFHRKTGICFRDWLAAVRVERAKELMAHSNAPVREVAQRVGYRHVRTFERVFRRVAGSSPLAYKMSVRPPHARS